MMIVLILEGKQLMYMLFDKGGNSMTIQEIFTLLKKPFEPKDVKWRIGRRNKEKTKAEVLAYIDGRAIQNRLDAVVGPENWSVSYKPVNFQGIDKNVNGFICELSITTPEETLITRQDGANLTDFEPFKGGVSDSFKRVASCFGIGRYLYNLSTTWVSIDGYGNFKKPTLPSWALPEGFTGEQTKETESIPEDTITETEPTDVVFTKGKYSNRLVKSVTDYSYLRWVLEKSNMEDEVKRVAEEVLKSVEGN
jgi:hypothetical protein